MIALCAPEAEGAVFTVGPGGTHATVQGAIDAAIAAGGDNEIRVQVGTYTEVLTVGPSMTAGSLLLQGGWDDTFSTRQTDPSLTILDGGGTNRVIEVDHGGGSVTLDGLQISGGHGVSDTAGLLMHADEATAFSILNCRFFNNHNVGGSFSTGGGARLTAHDSIQVTVADSVFEGNTISTDGGTGAGLYILGLGASTIDVVRNRFLDNVVSTANNGAGGVGLQSATFDTAAFVLEDNLFADNLINGDTPFGNAGVGARIEAFGNSSFTARRNRFFDNLDNTDSFGGQYYNAVGGSASGVVTDSLMVGGSHDGGTFFSFDVGAVMHVSNLAATGAGFAGIRAGAQVANDVSVYNSIAFGNTVADLDVDANTDVGSNLDGVDPLWVDAGALNFRIGPTSPARDGGTNTPPATLGTVDLDLEPRILDGLIDIGPFEFGIFVDGFESGDVSAWSASVP